MSSLSPTLRSVEELTILAEQVRARLHTLLATVPVSDEPAPGYFLELALLDTALTALGEATAQLAAAAPADAAPWAAQVGHWSALIERIFTRHFPYELFSRPS